jgi:hypothetical protein
MGYDGFVLLGCKRAGGIDENASRRQQVKASDDQTLL